jgi:hypothetical protein
MSLSWPAKDPSDVLDYRIDWTAILRSDTIETSTWSVPSALTVDSHSFTDTRTTVWLSGGTVGEHRITNTIVTASGRTLQRSVVLPVQEL